MKSVASMDLGPDVKLFSRPIRQSDIWSLTQEPGKRAFCTIRKFKIKNGYRIYFYPVEGFIKSPADGTAEGQGEARRG